MTDPAFLFYSKDFLTGVADLTMEERGQYITLLCLQHQKGHLSGKAVALALGYATADAAVHAAADVLAKFRQDSGGNFYNERLEEEMKKRVSHGEKQRQRALDGWKKRKENADNQENKKISGTHAGISHGNAAALPLGNANANAIVIGNVIQEKGGVGEKDDLPPFKNPYQENSYVNHAVNKPSSAAEVAQYLTNRHSYSDSDANELGHKFFSYYESQGWLKKNQLPVRDWKAQVDSWHVDERHKRLSKNGNNPKNNSSRPQPTNGVPAGKL